MPKNPYQEGSKPYKAWNARHHNVASNAAVIAPPQKLTDKQAAFVFEYLKDYNGNAAARRAGYGKQTSAWQLLERSHIREAIIKAQLSKTKRLQASQDYVVHCIIETVDRCRQAAPVVDKRGKPVMTETANGEKVPAYQFNAAGVFKGLELLGKHLNMFSDNLNVNHSGEVTHNHTTPRDRDTFNRMIAQYADRLMLKEGEQPAGVTIEGEAVSVSRDSDDAVIARNEKKFARTTNLDALERVDDSHKFTAAELREETPPAPRDGVPPIVFSTMDSENSEKFHDPEGLC